MSAPGFVHLRVHSTFSLLEGAVRIPGLLEKCRAYNMPAVAVTDTSNLFAALEFSTAAAEAGIQPILGCQLNVTFEEATRDPATPLPGKTPAPAAVVCLCQNESGYKNLLKLVSAAYLETETGVAPHVSVARLMAHNEGLLLLSGGIAGPLGRLIEKSGKGAAAALAERLSGAFSGRFYMEIQRHGWQQEERMEPSFLEMAYDLDIPLLATNEVFFPDRDMYEAHDALICVAEGRYLVEEHRRRLTPEHYFKSPEEMRTLFADLPEAVDNTLVVARRCAFLVEKIDPILPPFQTENGESEAVFLRKKAREDLDARLKVHVYKSGMNGQEREKVARPYVERLNHELDIIEEMGFPGYFLIVSDFIQWSKAQGIPVGPGRGSGAGSVVAWALTITDLDPLRFNLLFERFLNPERVSMPDFDIDFCQDRREEVIRYVQDKYGHDRVAQIITFGKLQARAVLRDVGRVLQMPYGQVDRICKMVPNDPGRAMSLEDAVNADPELKRMQKEEAVVAKLLDIGKKLEGLYRHASTHAAGVVIGDRPLVDLIPLYRDPRSEMPVSQFNMKWVESAGLVKFDFLGLKTLTVLSRAVEWVKRSAGETVDLSALPLEDPETFAMLGRAETVGVFQLESAGMRDVLRQLKPDTLEEVVAIVALYRPGPMDNIPSYINRKFGREEPDYLYPTLEPILKETYGIIVYQEQVMQIAQVLGGYSLGAADILRRAMGK